MSNWNTEDEMVGQTVAVYFMFGEECIEGEVVEVHNTQDKIRVKDLETGEILEGNQWEHLD